jgi:hypothetical protein
MGWHQAICQHIHASAQILLDASQEIQIIIPLEKHGLTVVTAVVEVAKVRDRITVNIQAKKLLIR